MIGLEAQQKTYQIAGVTLGGKPGEYPPVMIGSIFYRGHKIVENHEKGIFDRVKAKDLLEAEEELSRQYGLPRIIDVVAESAEAMCRYLDFVVEYSNSPFLIDSSNPEVRMTGIRYIAEKNLLERAIYNSIDPHSKAEEFEFLKEYGVKNVMIMAFDKKYLMPEKRLQLLNGEGESKGLLDAVLATGATNILIDPGVLDLPSTSWTSQAIFKIKDKLGYPAGCAPSNALYTWKRQTQVNPEAFQACGAAIFNLPLAFGADFLLYGPIANASWVYPSCAVAAASIAYGGRSLGVRPKTKEHPLFKVF